MRILLTNDDGINAPGLKALERIAAELGGPDAEIWVVAPAFEQSGVGHCVSYTHPMIVSEIAERRIATEGTPADCVLVALARMPEPPDLVLSGVNRGNNAGENALYSGTLGGALEGALQGIPSIALSQYYGPRNRDLANPFEAAEAHGAELIASLLNAAEWQSAHDYHLFYNINFPPVPAGEVKGARATTQGIRVGTGFTAVSQPAPSGRDLMWVKGGDQRINGQPGSDIAANFDDYIAVTPMRADFTAHDQLASLSKVLAP